MEYNHPNFLKEDTGIIYCLWAKAMDHNIILKKSASNREQKGSAVVWKKLS